MNVRVMECPDCKARVAKHGAFYTCSRCGLSFKPWEIQKARDRSRDELKALEEEDPEAAREKKKKERIRYRNWFEGRQQVD